MKLTIVVGAFKKVSIDLERRPEEAEKLERMKTVHSETFL